jgi:hypothetical protein
MRAVPGERPTLEPLSSSSALVLRCVFLRVLYAKLLSAPATNCADGRVVPGLATCDATNNRLLQAATDGVFEQTLG